MDRASHHKRLLEPFRAALYAGDSVAARTALMVVCAPDAMFRVCHPFGDLTGVDAFCDAVLEPLAASWRDLERRDWIVMAGPDEQGVDWVGCGGTYVGTFAAPWLDIPPTGHLAHMRFHEFYGFEDGRITRAQMIWDIPEVMMQARAWPLAPSLGREMRVPGPATQDGLVQGPWDAEHSTGSCRIVIDMLAHMNRHPGQGGAEVMEMPRFWHPRMTWYGPAGIGTARGISGFRNWHQIPFLAAMPDRGQNADAVTAHFFGDGDYAAVTGWPNMMQTLSADGWLGIAPAGRWIELRSLDFWRLEQGLIRENWVLIDLLDVYRQLGLDVFARLREFNKARVPGAVPFPVGEV